jgi:hypothetical protein
MAVALVFQAPGEDTGAEDGLQVINDNFMAIDLETGTRDINGRSETRDHQPGSAKLGPALQRGSNGWNERTGEMKRCGTRT